MALSTALITSQASAFDIIAHRGASGYLPEHTLEAATLAFAQQPDFIEQDVVATKDGELVVLHDIHLDTVTDVAAKFPDRVRDDGRWYALDFTLAELRTLQVKERSDTDGKQVFANRYHGSKALFTVATLDEHIELISELNREFNSNIGFYTEIKSPAWHKKEGVDISQRLLDTLARYNLNGENANIYVQCFDFAEVKRLRNELGFKGKIVLLLADNSWGESATDYQTLLTEQGMQDIAKYADGIGPWLPQLLDMKALQQGKIVPSPWLATAKKEGLVIHPYTFRIDALPTGMTAEQIIGLLTGPLAVDGVFTDQIPPVKNFLLQSGK
ncbi:glycerophosphodiester phosphodiesterase [Alteromonas confluentis]|uniref:glycerophosphodiester phosphodiesterase n=1 Tax=Alteromonas confluentis TaxID=1656094 RepID=A0A1E7ZFH8_9ALTE|nr:glycerophosphodiester phosphodiesterase [Alteromonas confluentis]OFC72273.1 glycerophosphodiester phosphodiesterase [Alteromonas confluentis]